MLESLAVPKSSMPYVQIALYRSNLFLYSRPLMVQGILSQCGRMQHPAGLKIDPFFMTSIDSEPFSKPI